jgi:pantoate--beta-alanine ligase
MTDPAGPIVVETITAVRGHVASARRRGRRIGFVPTMGALHDGHLSLVRRARQCCDTVVVSVFVNPTQFVAGEDYGSYPRILEADVAKCAKESVDLVFAPPADQMYGPAAATTVHVARLTEPLCGRHRPGHFDGVTTVVTKLFNIVQPDAAFFGQKDAQQAAVIRKMVVDLDIPVEVVVCPTVREPDGLAMSSRNAYLSAEQRQQALCLYRGLQGARRAIAEGRRDAAALVSQIGQTITAAGPCSIDYIEIVDPETLEPVTRVTQPVLIAVAVRIGKARLIDNVVVDPAAASE